MSLAEQILKLERDLCHLSKEDKRFASSLVEQFKNRGYLSDKQTPWVDHLLARCTGKGAVEKTFVGDFSGVLKLFDMAGKSLNHPKITLAVDELTVVLSVAGPHSKAPGTVNVTDGGGFGTGQWFGRVERTGMWTPGLRPDKATIGKVQGLLTRLSEAPAETASKYGKLTGRCCFCNGKLTDNKSLAAGYGPTCAKNFGLADKWRAASSAPAVKTLTEYKNREDNPYYRASRGY